jgi:potassium uptake TrkH family protein
VRRYGAPVQTWLGRFVATPARLLPGAFLLVILGGSVLLMLPGARVGPGGAEPLVALFTATSAVCVTGLAMVDTATYWTTFGQATILGLIQVGGFGITAFATLIVLVAARRLGLRTRLAAAEETKTLAFSDIRHVLRRVALTMAVVEITAGLLLTARFLVAYDEPLGRASWNGFFHAISAFNNAGFSLYSTNLVRYANDGVVVVVVCTAIVLGGIGFPVLTELVRQWRRPRRWSLHTQLTVYGTAALLLVGVLGILWFEWRNPATMGIRDTQGKVLVALFQGVQPRTAGFNTVNYTSMRQESLILTIMLMFVGGGSASTAGGVKVTTLAVLAFVVAAEVRASRDVTAFRRRIAAATQRQAAAILLLSASAIFTGAMAITAFSGFSFGEAFFEATSAFSTVGLSVGVTGNASEAAHLVLVLLMFMGRIGPVAAFAFFARDNKTTWLTYPESRPLVG